jgi:hypothetical protein
MESSGRVVPLLSWNKRCHNERESLGFIAHWNIETSRNSASISNSTNASGRPSVTVAGSSCADSIFPVYLDHPQSPLVGPTSVFSRITPAVGTPAFNELLELDDVTFISGCVVEWDHRTM